MAMRSAPELCIALMFASAPRVTPIALPGANGPVGFDDLRFSPELHRIIVPAGRTGRVDLVEPRDHAVEEIAGFSTSRNPRRGHGESTTSADAGSGLLFASDRTRRELVVADPTTRRIVARVALGGGPDYVRWVAPTREVWVTEPERNVIETFRLEATSPPTLTGTGTIDVPDGPEALEIDASRGRVYTNTWHDATLDVDIVARTVAARWENGCRGSRGLALDVRRGLVFVGCDEGAVVALDARHDGQARGRARTGAGVDVIAFSASLSHLYVPAEDAATIAIIDVAGDGTLSPLGEVRTARGAHCVTADDAGGVYVCDPEHGRLLTFHDSFSR